MQVPVPMKILLLPILKEKSNKMSSTYILFITCYRYLIHSSRSRTTSKTRTLVGKLSLRQRTKNVDSDIAYSIEKEWWVNVSPNSCHSETPQIDTAESNISELDILRIVTPENDTSQLGTARIDIVGLEEGNERETNVSGDGQQATDDPSKRKRTRPKRIKRFVRQTCRRICCILCPCVFAHADD